MLGLLLHYYCFNEYIEFPPTTEKRPFYHVNGNNLSVHSVVHTYQHDTNQPFIPHDYQNWNQTQNFESNESDLLHDPIPINPPIQNVKPPTKNSSRIFIPLPYLCLHFEKIDFQNPDLTDSESIQLYQILVANNDCYATRRNNAGKVFAPFPDQGC